MEATEKPRPIVVVLHIVAASVLFYLGVAMMLLSPGGDPHESSVEAALPLLIFTIPALLITARIAWLLRRAESPQSTARSLWLTVPISIGAVVVGAVLADTLRNMNVQMERLVQSAAPKANMAAMRERVRNWQRDRRFPLYFSILVAP